MKTSIVRIYTQDAQVPSYKSAGASGFDLRVKYTENRIVLSKYAINTLLHNGVSTYPAPIVSLYYELYNLTYKPISCENFIAAIDRAIDDFHHENRVNIIDYMNDNNLDYINFVPPQSSVVLKTGLHMEIPEDLELQIRPRSGISAKTMLQVALGTVDSDYRGEIGIIVQNPSNYAYIIPPGMRLAQGVIVEKYQASFVEVESLNCLEKTNRGSGGFGSTGNN